MTPITLTERGRQIGVAELHDCGADFLWPILELCFPDARTITRSSEGWFVDVETPQETHPCDTYGCENTDTEQCEGCHRWFCAGYLECMQVVHICDEADAR